MKGRTPASSVTPFRWQRPWTTCIVAYGQNGEPVRVEQGYPIRMIVPGWEGPHNVKYLSHIKVMDEPYHTWNESMNHSVVRADIGGKARWYHFEWGPKSVITRPSAGLAIPGKGYVQITGLAWSGAGKVTKVDISTDGGKTWKEARIQTPVHTKAHTRFTFDWAWDGGEAVLLSRCTDETGDVQPSRAELFAHWGISERGSSQNRTAPFISMPCSLGSWPATGACTMRCSVSLLASAMILAAPALGLAQSPAYNVGTPLSQDEIQKFDFMIGPEGQQLPAGHGSAKEGAVIFAQRCEVCHGKNGQSGVLRRLVLGSPGKPFLGPFKDNDKDSVAYYPYATIAWDYINRAMPVPKPGSLTHDEVYALTAFLLYRNGIIQEADVMDAQSLPKVQMPNRNGFLPAKPVYPPEPKPSWW